MLAAGAYDHLITLYRELFGPERVHVILLEDVVADEANVLRGLCKFLGVDYIPFDPAAREYNTGIGAGRGAMVRAYSALGISDDTARRLRPWFAPLERLAADWLKTPALVPRRRSHDQGVLRREQLQDLGHSGPPPAVPGLRMLNTQMSELRLMVLIPDRLSDLVNKGEVTERYYNPGNLFDEVHLVMTNDDRPDPVALQKMVGNARLFLHNLPDSRKAFMPTLGWRPWLLGPWTAKALSLAQTVRPVLIRCHGALLNTFAAASIKRKLGVPYVVSMHINPDEDVRGRARGWVKRIVTWMQQDVERIGLLNADLVMPVYQPIVPYLQRLGVTRYEVCYNSLNPTHLRRKDDYTAARSGAGDFGRTSIRGEEPGQPDPRHRRHAERAVYARRRRQPYHGHLRDVAAECGIWTASNSLPRCRTTSFAAACRNSIFLPPIPNTGSCRNRCWSHC